MHYTLLLSLPSRPPVCLPARPPPHLPACAFVGRICALGIRIVRLRSPCTRCPSMPCARPRPAPFSLRSRPPALALTRLPTHSPVRPPVRGPACTFSSSSLSLSLVRRPRVRAGHWLCALVDDVRVVQQTGNSPAGLLARLFALPPACAFVSMSASYPLTAAHSPCPYLSCLPAHSLVFSPAHLPSECSPTHLLALLARPLARPSVLAPARPPVRPAARARGRRVLPPVRPSAYLPAVHPSAVPAQRALALRARGCRVRCAARRRVLCLR
ncbi:uncharacterized protein B0H18DRAFT_324538 [Fomitopsis serialis]|uniref:uncharacterized protein n=1 Tax=Fomitopsis serialis TaxID=139415 RepID=UPI0020071F01|nr:uncharacterized protein B0H18DRAFT_324538 [Neoantrodia serialis]KAH9936505.1 hypothetical protein B0H18DRAFT_324538 [Neoantrodia serialis]